MKVFSFVICLFFVVGTSWSQTGQKKVIPLTTANNLTLLNVQAESVQLQGKSGLRIAKSPPVSNTKAASAPTRSASS